jgi:hypothetical protein
MNSFLNSVGLGCELRNRTSIKENTPEIKALSSDDDPRLKKLKKELQKIDIAPKKTKYISFKV